MTSCLTGGYQKIQMCQIHSVIKGVYTKEEGLQLQQYLPDNKILSVTKIITYVDYGMNCVVYTGTPTTQARAFTSPWIVSRASLFFGGRKKSLANINSDSCFNSLQKTLQSKFATSVFMWRHKSKWRKIWLLSWTKLRYLVDTSSWSQSKLTLSSTNDDHLYSFLFHNPNR